MRSVATNEVEDHPDLLTYLPGRECSTSMTADKRKDVNPGTCKRNTRQFPPGRVVSVHARVIVSLQNTSALVLRGLIGLQGRGEEAPPMHSEHGW